jgi:hypothetical protein
MFAKAVNLELKRRRKGQVFSCSRVESCNLTRSQLTAIVEGGTALFGVHKTGHRHPRGWQGWWPKIAVRPFCISGITLSSELWFQWSRTFWKDNKKLYRLELVVLGFELKVAPPWSLGCLVPGLALGYLLSTLKLGGLCRCAWKPSNSHTLDSEHPIECECDCSVIALWGCIKWH